MVDLTQPKYRGYNKEAVEFLCESNAIEGVYDEDSLDQAIYAWWYLFGETKEKLGIKLTPGVILKTHKILMLHQHLHPNERGHWRRENVEVGGYIALDWQGVPAAMEEWVDDVKTTLIVPGKGGANIKIDHIQFEKIHPFVDGNGRVGRLLMLWETIKSHLPIKIIYEKDKYKYYKWFEMGA